MPDTLEIDDVPLMPKHTAQLSDEHYTEILQRAYNAGARALDTAPPPESVIVGQARDKPIWGANMYGRTGQAWVSFPHASPFTRFIRKAGYGSNVPAGGYGIMIRQGGQDGIYKRAFAKAFVASLASDGIIAHAHIMMD